VFAVAFLVALEAGFYAEPMTVFVLPRRL